MDGDTALPHAVRRAVGAALAGSPATVAALLDWAQQPPLTSAPSSGQAGGAGRVSE
jgi:hypothetical protein